MNTENSLPSEPPVRCIRWFGVSTVLHMIAQFMMCFAAGQAIKNGYPVVGGVMLLIAGNLNGWFWWRKRRTPNEKGQR